MKNSPIFSFLALVIMLSLVVGAGCSKAAKPETAPAAPVSQAMPSVIPSPVAATATGVSDLVITDVQLDGLTINYKIKNIGTGDSPQTYSQLSVNDLTPTMGSSSFVDVLKPGQERLASFSNYQWYSKDFDVMTQTQVNSTGYIELPLHNSKVMVCADAKNNAGEAVEANNCKVIIVGILWDYDMLSEFNLAAWSNGEGNLPEPGSENSAGGAHFKLNDASTETVIQLLTVPQHVPNGWVQGTWGYFYADEYHSPKAAAIKIPTKLHFVSRIGLAGNAKGSDGATFKFGLKDLNGNVNWIASKKMTVPGAFEDWDINLSSYEGQKDYFLLRVEAGASPVNDFAVWNKARLMQVNDF